MTKVMGYTMWKQHSRIKNRNDDSGNGYHEDNDASADHMILKEFIV